jgi:hypothetical protein
MYKRGIYKYIRRINHIVYSMNILGIQRVYQKLFGICMVYTRFISGIFQSHAVLTNMPGIYLLHNSWVCSVPFFIITISL